MALRKQTEKGGCLYGLINHPKLWLTSLIIKVKRERVLRPKMA